ncbi:hypothetical protein EUGRSUZ_F03916 [Eucalyptus grandis]|uniref:Fe2OG dioxygenase domain-containing protein n=2 Tax=Eucalyptus grandis TaxID=71139 RepID=A0A059BXQ8_EUCGR|nr:hypothetical protein EUGRSUZ_F03916 [Eucalyptus grandis]
MAEAADSLPPAEVLLSKRVQELVINQEEPPHLYICRKSGEATDEEQEENVSSDPLTQIPVIDLSILSASSSPSSEHDGELQKLRLALSSWGCFLATGHGIPSSFLDEIVRVSREFFEQPMEEKRKLEKGVEEFEGYGGDPVPAKGQPLDWSDRLFLDVYPEDRRKLKFWPENPPSFRDVLQEYTVKMRLMTEAISKAMAKSLDLQEDCFLIQFGEKAPLQVLKGDKWFTVPTISGALLVLMADQMEIMTNGVFKSPVHRVLSSSERDRISLAVFYTPEPNKEIGPEEALITEKSAKAYKTVKDYADVHWDYYQQGLRAIHVAKV